MKRDQNYIEPNFFIKLVIVVLLIFVAFCLFVPWIFPVNLSETDLTNRLVMPSFIDSESNHLLGTDQLGRDLLIRMLYASRTTIMISSLGMIGASLIGIIMGLFSGYLGGVVDDGISFITETFISVPTTFLGIVIATVFGASPTTTILVIIASGWAPFCRITRAQVLQVKNLAFVEASYTIGAGSQIILGRHILPNIASPLIIQATSSLSGFILLESTLSFLGIGIQPPGTSLGVMVSEGRDHLLTHWWLAIAPSIIMVFLIMSISIIGDWLRDSLDPKLRNSL